MFITVLLIDNILNWNGMNYLCLTFTSYRIIVFLFTPKHERLPDRPTYFAIIQTLIKPVFVMLFDIFLTNYQLHAFYDCFPSAIIFFRSRYFINDTKMTLHHVLQRQVCLMERNSLSNNGIIYKVVLERGNWFFYGCAFHKGQHVKNLSFCSFS
jgi:hypothetical protein